MTPSKTISILIIICSSMAAYAQMRVVYPQNVKIDLSKHQSFFKRSKLERKEQRRMRKEKVQNDVKAVVNRETKQTMDSMQAVAKERVNAMDSLNEKMKAIESRMVAQMTTMFPDIPVRDIWKYSGALLKDTTGMKSSVKKFLTSYYPPDSISGKKVSSLADTLIQDMEPRIKAWTQDYGVWQELSKAQAQSGIATLAGGAPKDPMDALGIGDPLAGATQNLASRRESLNHLNDLRKESKIAAKQFLTKNYKDHFKGHEQVLEKAQAAVKLVRQKPPFRDVLKEFVNQHNGPSFKQKKLHERFEVGGYMNYFISKPGYLDVAPTFAYQVTGRITAGVGGNYRIPFGKTEQQVKGISPQAPGWRSFINYDLFGNIFLNNELERLYVPVKDSEPRVSQGVTGYLIGLGSEVNVRKQLKMVLLLQYNTLYNNNTPYPKAWTIKAGFKL